MRFLPVIVWAFGLVSLLWFAGSLALLAPVLFGQPARSPAHALYGYTVAAVQAGVAAGWVWAFYRSIRGRTVVNGWREAMCAATAVAQMVIIVATMALIGGQIPGGRANVLVGDALAAVLLMAWIRRARNARVSTLAEVASRP